MARPGRLVRAGCGHFRRHGRAHEFATLVRECQRGVMGFFSSVIRSVPICDPGRRGVSPKEFGSVEYSTAKDPQFLEEQKSRKKQTIGTRRVTLDD